jgi:hypothetical protein
MSDDERLLGGLGTLAAGDLGMRFLPDVAGVGDQIVVPAAVFSSRLLFDAATVGWVVNWLTLFALAAITTPYLFPERLLDWTATPTVRLSVAVGATATGLVVESGLRAAILGQPSPLPVAPSPLVAAGAVGSGTGLLVAATALGGLAWPSPRSAPDRTYLALPDGVGRTGPLQRVLRGTLLVVTLGIVFATAAQLYPVTELLVVGGAVYALLDLGAAGVEDPVERLAVGAVAAWGGYRHAAALAYLLAALLVLTGIALDTLGAFPVATLLGQGPVGVALLVALLLVPTLHVLAYADRAFRSFAGELNRQGRSRALLTPSRAPGFMIPAGALFGLLPLLFERGEGLVRPVTPPVWALIVALAALTLWTAYATAPVRLRLPDYHAVPLAIAAWIAAGSDFGNLEFGIGARLVTGRPIGPGIAIEAALSAAVVVIVVSLAYAPVASAVYDGDDALGTVLVLWTAHTAVLVVVFGPLYVLDGTPPVVAFAESLPSSPVEAAALLLWTLTFFPAAAYTGLAVLSGRLWPRFEAVDAD